MLEFLTHRFVDSRIVKGTFLKFQYTWVYKEKRSISTDQIIWLRNRKDFLFLINKWSRQNPKTWSYWYSNLPEETQDLNQIRIEQNGRLKCYLVDSHNIERIQ